MKIKESQEGNTSKALGAYIILTIITLFVIGPYFGVIKIGTFVLLPVLGIISFYLSIKQDIWIVRKQEFIFFLMVFLLGLFSIFFYKDLEGFTSNMTRLSGALLGSFCALRLSHYYTNHEDYFHIAYILTILGLIIIMITNGNFIIGTLSGSEALKRDAFMINANTYSYYSFFANFSLFILHLKYKKRITFIGLIILPILFILVSFVTQSRSGLLFTILVNIVFWVFIQKIDTTNKIKKVSLTIFSFAVLLVLFYQFIIFLLQSDFKERLDVNEGSSQERQGIIVEAVQLFLENPILGVGMGQYPTYSKFRIFTHNSYFEALSEQGILAGILIFIVLIRPIWIGMKLYTHHKNVPEVKVQLLFFILFAFFNNFYVFYKFSFAMIFFFVMIAYQEKVKIELNRSFIVKK